MIESCVTVKALLKINSYFETYKKLEEKVGRKPGSVLLRGQLSIWDACYQTPQAALFSGTGKRPTIAPFALLPTGVYRASASQRCWCALTAPLHPYHIQC